MSSAVPASQPEPWFTQYVGRFKAMMAVCGPPSWPTLFASASDVQTALHMVTHPTGVDAATLATSQRLVAATLHPDTLQPIPLPFRMAAHVPANTVLVLGMLTSTSVWGSAFWQFANQSFNACQFYANRNATNTVSNTHLVLSYLCSVTTSVATAVALRRRVARLPPRSRGARVAAMVTPLVAAAAAKPLQIGCMRLDEVTRGVDVFASPTAHDAGDALASSRRAGGVALAQTIATRVLYLAPPMVIPPVLMAALAPRLPHAAYAVAYTLTVGACSAFATPACIALFDQWAALPAAVLEPHVQERAAAAGSRTVYFNKGL